MLETILLSANLAAALLLAMTGVVGALFAANAVKRVAGGAIAYLGALIALAALGASSAMLLAGIAAALLHLGMGLAIAIRLQEAYGAAEAAEIDAADHASEPVERGG